MEMFNVRIVAGGCATPVINLIIRGLFFKKKKPGKNTRLVFFDV
jgi:hypothetical protein